MKRALLIVWLLATASVASAQRQAFFIASVATTNSTTPNYAHGNVTSTVEASGGMTLPFDVKVKELDVRCTTGVTVANQTYTMRAGGADLNVACTITAGGSTCSEHTLTSATVTAGTYLSIRETASAAGGNAPFCRVFAHLVSSSGGEVDDIIQISGTGNFKAGNICSVTQGITFCGSAAVDANVIPVSKAGVLTGVAIALPNLPAGASVGFRICKAVGTKACDTDANGDTGIRASLTSGSPHYEVYFPAGCANSSCTVGPGDALYAKIDTVSASPAPGSKQMHISYTLSGQGQSIFFARNQSWSINMYAMPYTSSATQSDALYRLPVDALLNGLVCLTDVSPVTQGTVSLCDGTSTTPTCPADGTGTGVACTFAPGGTTCGSSGTLQATALDYVTTKLTALGGTTSNYVLCVAEMAGPSESSFTPTATNTPTITQTATITATPTITPTAIAGCCQPTPGQAAGESCTAPNSNPTPCGAGYGLILNASSTACP